MTDQTATWAELRRIADEVELKIHLAGMDARDRWRALEPRIVDLEHRLATTGKRAGDVVARELAAVGTALRRLRDDVKKPLA